MKETRMYSLFEKQDDKWVRISKLEFKKSEAVKVFQDALLAPVMGGHGVQGPRELKPLKK